ncbi:MAG: hypothetical protein ACPGXX_10715 [Planctomycetaceae bacterium]
MAWDDHFERVTMREQQCWKILRVVLIPHNNTAVASHFAAKFFLSWLVCADVLRRLNKGSAGPA